MCIIFPCAANIQIFVVLIGLLRYFNLPYRISLVIHDLFPFVVYDCLFHISFGYLLCLEMLVVHVSLIRIHFISNRWWFPQYFIISFDSSLKLNRKSAIHVVIAYACTQTCGDHIITFLMSSDIFIAILLGF